MAESRYQAPEELEATAAATEATAATAPEPLASGFDLRELCNEIIPAIEEIAELLQFDHTYAYKTSDQAKSYISQWQSPVVPIKIFRVIVGNLLSVLRSANKFPDVVQSIEKSFGLLEEKIKLLEASLATAVNEGAQSETDEEQNDVAHEAEPPLSPRATVTYDKISDAERHLANLIRRATQTTEEVFIASIPGYSRELDQFPDTLQRALGLAPLGSAAPTASVAATSTSKRRGATLAPLPTVSPLALPVDSQELWSDEFDVELRSWCDQYAIPVLPSNFTKLELAQVLYSPAKGENPEKLVVERKGKGGSFTAKEYYFSEKKQAADFKLLLRDLLREAGAISLLNKITAKNNSHPNLVAPIGIILDRESKRMSVLMPFYPDGSVKDALASPLKKPDFEKKLAILLDVAKGLSHLHRYGLMHRDIKAANVLLCEKNAANGNICAKLCDFELMGALQSLTPTIRKYDKEGTLLYRAPEVIGNTLDGKDPAPETLKADIYSFGVMIWEMLTNGEIPFFGMRDQEAAELIANGKLPDFPIKEDKMPECFLIPLMKQCLSFDPGSRPSADELVRTLNTLSSAYASTSKYLVRQKLPMPASSSPAQSPRGSVRRDSITDVNASSRAPSPADAGSNNSSPREGGGAPTTPRGRPVTPVAGAVATAASAQGSLHPELRASGSDPIRSSPSLLGLAALFSESGRGMPGAASDPNILRPQSRRGTGSSGGK